MGNIISKNEAKKLAKGLGLPAGPLSYTQINEFLMCPRSYYYKYVKQSTPRKFSERMTLGSVMHGGLENLLLQKQRNIKRPKIKIIHNYMKDLLYSYTHNHKIHSDDLKSIEMKLHKCVAILTDWSNKEYESLNPTGIEKKLYTVIAGIPIVVKIDFIDNDEKISDFKLSKKFKSQKDVDTSLQLSLYSIATNIKKVSFITFKYPVIRTFYKKKNKELYKEVIGYRRPSELEWSEEVVDSITTSILSEQYHCCDTGSWKCTEDYCDNWMLCRGKYKKEEKEIKEPDWMKG